jgi:hypothetical protein
VNGDGFADIIVGTGNGTPGHVRIFSGKDLTTELMSFLPFDRGFKGRRVGGMRRPNSHGLGRINRNNHDDGRHGADVGELNGRCRGRAGPSVLMERIEVYIPRFAP